MCCCVITIEFLGVLGALAVNRVGGPIAYSPASYNNCSRSPVGRSLRRHIAACDPPSPASGQWPTSIHPSFSAVGHKSLPPAGSGPANEYRNALLARPKGRAYNYLTTLNALGLSLSIREIRAQDTEKYGFLKEAEPIAYSLDDPPTQMLDRNLRERLDVN
jgi:hypothetical protein